MKTQLPIRKAAEIVGSQVALASALGTSKQNISSWIRTERVPTKYCPDIEQATNGQVTCEELRPDVNWSVLRNKKGSTNA